MDFWPRLSWIQKSAGGGGVLYTLQYALEFCRNIIFYWGIFSKYDNESQSTLI